MRPICLSFAVLISTSLLAQGPAVAPPADDSPVSASLAPSSAITAEQAVLRAVNRLQVSATGVTLEHPRRRIDFTADGLGLTARANLVWSWRFAGAAASSGRVVVAPAPIVPVALDGERVRYARGPIVEDYVLGTDGVEQTFVIEAPLPLEGADLVISGEVRSTGTFATSGDGWSWSGAGSEATLGAASVIDHQGRAIPSRFEVTADRTRLVVDGASLEGAAYPVLVDPQIGSNDYRISDMGPNGDPDYDAFDAAVAYNSINNQYLVVWAGDDTPGGLVEGEYEIFGQVLSGSGSEIGYSDVRISYAGGTGSIATRAYHPAVAFNSIYNQYLVVWSADHPEDGCVDGEFEIWGQVIDPYIFPLFGDNFRISFNGGSGNAAFDADYPAVVYNPGLDEYLVVWQGDHNTGGMVDEEFEIWAQRVYSAGTLTGSNLRMSDMGGSGDPDYGAFVPTVAFNSLNLEYLVVWQGDDNAGSLVNDEFEIFGQRITQTGAGVGTNDQRISDMGGTGDAAFDAFHPAVAYNSTDNQYVVVWQGDDNVGGLVDNEFEVFAQRMDADMDGLGANDARVSDVGGTGDVNYDVAWGPEIAYDARMNRYFVVWGGEDSVGGMVNNEWEIFGQMMTATLSGVGPNDECLSDAGGIGEFSFTTYSPVVAANAKGEFLVAWDGDDNVGGLVLGEHEIFVQRIAALLFMDGFESATTNAWSVVVP